MSFKDVIGFILHVRILSARSIEQPLMRGLYIATAKECRRSIAAITRAVIIVTTIMYPRCNYINTCLTKRTGTHSVVWYGKEWWAAVIWHGESPASARIVWVGNIAGVELITLPSDYVFDKSTSPLHSVIPVYFVVLIWGDSLNCYHSHFATSHSRHVGRTPL